MVYRRDLVNFLNQIKEDVLINQKQRPEPYVFLFSKKTKNSLYSKEDIKKSLESRSQKEHYRAETAVLLKRLKKEVER